MKLEEIYSNLCTYDPRSPYYEDLKHCLEDEIPEPRRKDCGCDNCYHGCDKLANELLKSAIEKEKLIMLRNYIGITPKSLLSDRQDMLKRIDRILKR